MSDSTVEPGTVLDGRYRLDSPLGEGGMGMVWRAHHLELDAPVAVKLVRSLTSDKALERFKREARAAAKLRGQHVVQVFDHGVADGVPYIVMELLEGESLKDRLTRARMQPSELDEVFRQLARAIERAHDNGIVHRDIKPGNVHLVPDGDGHIVKLLDFGIAKLLDSVDDASTKTGALMGTPFYMSPEQLSDSKHVAPNADLWSLAVIAFEALVGKRPYDGATIGAIAMKLAADPPVPSEHGPVPKGFDAWFAKATARAPEDRFASAHEMADALSEVLQNEIVDLALQATETAGTGDVDALKDARGVIARSVAESTAGAAPQTPSVDSRWRTWGWPLSVLVVAGGVYLATQPEDAGPTSETHSVRSSHAVSSAAASASATVSAAPLASPTSPEPSLAAFPCDALFQPKDAPCKRDGYRAWCDVDGSKLACCEKGLVPVDASGMCACPPGGTSEAAAQDKGCKASAGVDMAALQAAIRSKFPELKACYEAARDRNDKLSGRIMVEFTLDAAGHLLELRIAESALPDRKAQACVLDTWRSIAFDPPPEGFMKVNYPLTFSSDE